MTTKYFPTVDELLGERSGRYFGEGYLKTRQSVTNFSITDEGNALSFTCSGSVTLPVIWSQKGENAQTPHLSTIDVLELTQSCIDAFNAKTLHRAIGPKLVVHEIEIVAGKSPIEGELSAVPIKGVVSRADDVICSLNLDIANMNVTVALGDVHADEPSRLLTDKGAVSIRNVLVDSDAMIAAGLVTPDFRDASHDWDLSTCFSSALQLGQSVLYEMDQISRSESNTLWMKRTSISRQASQLTQEIEQPIFVWIENTRRYQKPDGVWRRADICSRIAGTKVVCSVTHRLPQRVWNLPELSAA